MLLTTSSFSFKPLSFLNNFRRKALQYSFSLQYSSKIDRLDLDLDLE